MKKRLLSILLTAVLLLTLLPTMALAAGNTYTETRFGLTVTQTGTESQGFSLGAKSGGSYAHDYDAYVSITKSGTYTISGTYNDNSGAGTFTDAFLKNNPSGMRGIIDVSNAPEGSNITLILDNLTIETDSWQTPPILISRQSSSSTVNVTIQLKGSNLLANNAGAYGGGAIVKQDGAGNLTFVGDGSLTAKALDVAIGAPIIYYGSDNWVSSNCTNITFAQTGSITADVKLGTGTPVGVSGAYRTGTASVMAGNINVQSGTLNLINKYSGTLSEGAMLGASGRYNYFSNIQITGGKITTSTPNATVGSKFYSIGGYSRKNNQGVGVNISGGTIVSSLLPYAQDTRSGDDAYEAYIATSSSVSSLSVKVNGETYTYTANGMEPQNGKVWLWLPCGNAAVTLNGTTYYGMVDSSNNTELKQGINPVTDITGLPAEMNANSTITLAGVVSPTAATFTNISKYEILDAGTTMATLNGNKLSAKKDGTISMRAIVGNGLGTQDYVKEFTVIVHYVPIQDLTCNLPPNMTLGQTIALTGNISPSDACYKDIVWSVKSGPGSISGNNLTATGIGDITITATVENGTLYGTPYIKDFQTTALAADELDLNVDSVRITQSTSDSSKNTVSYSGFVGGQKDYDKNEILIVKGALDYGADKSITVNGTNAKIQFQDLNVKSSICSILNLENGADVTLLLSGTSSIAAKNTKDGVNPAIHVPQGTKLTIDGDGSLIAINKQWAFGTDDCYAAVIGSGVNSSSGEIIIQGGFIRVYPRKDGAAIGGGKAGAGNVKITGGTVEVYNSSDSNGGLGAGIGNAASSSNVVINGGSVKTNTISADNFPQNTSGVKVYKTEVNLSDTVGANTFITSGSIEGLSYGFNKVKTGSDGKVYLYLPENPNTKVVINGQTYVGSVTTANNSVLTKKTAGTASVTMQGWSYGSAANDPVPMSTTNGTTGVTYQYKVKGAADSTYTATKPIAAGDYTVQATFPETDTYAEVKATADFTIGEVTVTGVTVDPATASVEKGKTKQFTASVIGTNTPAQVTWTVIGGKTGTSIDSTGLLTIAADETAANLTVTATSTADTNQKGTAAVTVTAASDTRSTAKAITAFSIDGAAGVINENNHTIQVEVPYGIVLTALTPTIMISDKASVSPACGVTKDFTSGVTYTVTAENGTCQSYTVTVTTAQQPSVTVTGITVSGANITTNGGVQQMSAVVTPDTASNKNVTWSITNGSSFASISDTGLLTAIANGTVTVRATAKDGSGKYGEAIIEISGQTSAITNKVLTGITAPGAITGVTNGTAKTASALGLPLAVTLVTDQGSVTANVAWAVDSSSYDASVKTAQTFAVNGTVTLPAGVVNTSNIPLTTNINVTVNAATAQTYPYSVEFTVKDASGNAVTGAAITVNGTSYAPTDASGKTTCSGSSASKTVTYVISKAGYQDFTGSIGDVTTTTQQGVTLIPGTPAPTTYSATFGVTYAGTPLSGAMVTVNGATYTTAANGMVMVPNLPNGTYYYNVSCGGFNPQTGSFMISGSSTSVPVSLTVYTAPSNTNNNRDHDKKDNNNGGSTQTTASSVQPAAQAAAQPQAASAEIGAAVTPPAASAPAGTGQKAASSGTQGSGTPASGSTQASSESPQTMAPYVAVVQASRSASEVQETVMEALTSGTYSQAEVQKLQTAAVDKVNKMNAVSAAGAAAANTQIGSLIDERNALFKAFKAAGAPVKGLTDTVVVNVKPTAGTVLALNKQMLSSLRSTGIVKIVVTSGNTTSVITLNARAYSRASSITCTLVKVKGKLVPRIRVK